jgi:methionyl-tRNA formyltransferase
MTYLSTPLHGKFLVRPKIVFMGTPDYAVASLDALVEAGHTVLAVVTQPDRPKGRSKKLVPPPVKQAARGMNLEVLQPENASDSEFCRIIEELQPDILVVVAFGQVLKRALLDIPPWGGLNIHASLLPRYRGAGPIQWAIIDGEKQTGLTSMVMEEGLDTGPILLQKKVPIGQWETAGELHDRLSMLSGDLLLETLGKLSESLLIPQTQDSLQATYAPKIDKRISVIDWLKPAKSLAALIRGLDPFPGAVTFVGEKRIKLFSPRVVDMKSEEPVPGTVLDYSREGLFIETGKGILEIREMQAMGKKRLPTDAFLRGFPMEKGTVLGKNL